MALLLALLRFARVSAAQLDRQLCAFRVADKLPGLLLPEMRITIVFLCKSENFADVIWKPPNGISLCQPVAGGAL